ncbi:MAG: two-component sensor histidine kinase [Candidatus Latescibacterota bacterium]|jgi:two-component sensor histidine kinase
MLRYWIQKIKRVISSDTPAAVEQPSISTLLQFLTQQISEPGKAPSILASIERYNKLPAAEQGRELPLIYLLLEKYVVEIDSQQQFTRSQLRSMISSRYDDLMSLPQFGFIFQPALRQERHLCGLFFEAVAHHAYIILGNSSAHLPFELNDSVSGDKAEWATELRRTAHQVYHYLEGKLGQQTTGIIFEHAYQQVQDIYVGLETFPSIIRLLPDQLLDECKIDLLSRSQMQYVLHDKIEEMHHINAELSRNNATLETTQKQLQQAKGELELRVAERTRKLRQANQQISDSLAEKDILLKEIHHRVKNNLQIISSLLSLQSMTLKDPKVIAAFDESRNRVLSMALIHEKLYQSNDLVRIDFSEYVEELAASLSESYQITPGNVRIEVSIIESPLNVDSAISCGLIINELITNCFKYAFPEGRQGHIRISLGQGEGRELVLAVIDDGIGMPTDLDFHCGDSLGLKVVNALALQLHGQLKQLESSGTHIELRFTPTQGDSP